MAINILDLAKGELGGALMSQIGGILGQDQLKTESAVSATLPALLGGMIVKTSEEQGAGELLAKLDDVDDGFLDNLGELIGDGKHESVISKSNELLSGLLGAHELGSVAATVAKVSGLSRSSVGSLLGLLTPVLMGIIGRERKSQALDAGGLAALLSSQKEHLVDLPGGISELPGLGGLLSGTAGLSTATNGLASCATGLAADATAAVTGSADAAVGAAGDVATAAMGSAAHAATTAAGAGSSILGKMVPLIVFVLLAVAAVKFFKSDPPATIPDPAIVEPSRTAPGGAVSVDTNPPMAESPAPGSEISGTFDLQPATSANTSDALQLPTESQ